MSEAMGARCRSEFRWLCASAAIVGGGLRVASTFIPWRAEDGALEAFYGLIDVCLMFGLLGVYLHTVEQTGRSGLAAFAIALVGVSSIVGPDSLAFGIDFYKGGALMFVLGLAGLSVQLVRVGQLRASAVCWLATLALTIAGAAISITPALTIAGAFLGAGFALAGISMIRR